MTDIDEADFHARVLSRLQDAFGTDRVRSEVWLDGPDRLLDIAVDLPELGTGLAIELEDNPAGCIKGVGQAVVYSQTLGYLPVVAYPKETHDEAYTAELSALSDRVQIVTL